MTLGFPSYSMCVCVCVCVCMCMGGWVCVGVCVSVDINMMIDSYSINLLVHSGFPLWLIW